jgi:hypothetical protein
LLFQAMDGSTALIKSYSPPPAGSAPPSSAEPSSPWAARARSRPRGSGTERFTRRRTVYTQKNGLHAEERFTHRRRTVYTQKNGLHTEERFTHLAQQQLVHSPACLRLLISRCRRQAAHAPQKNIVGQQSTVSLMPNARAACRRWAR